MVTGEAYDAVNKQQNEELQLFQVPRISLLHHIS